MSAFSWCPNCNARHSISTDVLEPMVAAGEMVYCGSCETRTLAARWLPFPMRPVVKAHGDEVLGSEPPELEATEQESEEVEDGDTADQRSSADVSEEPDGEAATGMVGMVGDRADEPAKTPRKRARRKAAAK